MTRDTLTLHALVVLLLLAASCGTSSSAQGVKLEQAKEMGLRETPG